METKQKIDETQFIRWNEEMVEKYDPECYHLRSGFFIRYLAKKRVRTVNKLLGPEKEDHVLEVGCGAGNVIQNTDVENLYGIDISEKMIHRIKERFRHKNVKLIRANAEKLPLKNNQLDKIICSELIEHVYNPSKTMSEMIRVLKPNGILIITIPNERRINFAKRIMFALKLNKLFEKEYKIPDRMNDEWHLHLFSLEVLKKLVNSKFDIIKIKRIPIPLFPLGYVVKCKKSAARIGEPDPL